MTLPNLPAFAWIDAGNADDDAPDMRLAIIIYPVRSGRLRGKLWLGERWSALRSFGCGDIVGWADREAAERMTRGEDWRDYRGDAVIDGVRPRRGMYLVHHERRRVYGRVKRVTDKGAVIWSGPLCDVPTRPETLHAGGYSYADEVPDGYEPIAAGGFDNGE